MNVSWRDNKTITISDRQFRDGNDDYGKKIKVFDRKAQNNINDIVNSAALAFHKSLIGISELFLVEEQNVNLRQTKAVLIYYAVYHLFCCAMLLDPEYEIVFMANKDGSLRYGTTERQLNDQSERPEAWRFALKYETDLASRIKHSEIQEYCSNLRKRYQEDQNKLSPWSKILYRSFVKAPNNASSKCIPGLFEKLEYIRDRALYRPTAVWLNDKKQYAQTSLEIREQIESEPSSSGLYEIIKAFWEEILRSKDNTICRFVGMVMGSFIDCETEYANQLGYTWEQLELMNGCQEDQTVPSYICQMMELYDPEVALMLFERFWKRIVNNDEDNSKSIKL